MRSHLEAQRAQHKKHTLSNGIDDINKDLDCLYQYDPDYIEFGETIARSLPVSSQNKLRSSPDVKKLNVIGIRPATKTVLMRNSGLKEARATHAATLPEENTSASANANARARVSVGVCSTNNTRYSTTLQSPLNGFK